MYALNSASFISFIEQSLKSELLQTVCFVLTIRPTWTITSGTVHKIVKNTINLMKNNFYL